MSIFFTWMKYPLQTALQAGPVMEADQPLLCHAEGTVFPRSISLHSVMTFACYSALRLRSDEKHILTPLSEEILRPERSRALCGVVEGQCKRKSC